MQQPLEYQQKPLSRNIRYPFSVSFRALPLLFIYGGIMSHFRRHVKGIYKLLQLLHFLTITKREHKKGKPLHYFH